MAKIKSLDELISIREDSKKMTQLRNDDKDNNIRVTVGMATCGIAAGARETFRVLREEAEKIGLDNVRFIQTGCMGNCNSEPIVEVKIPGREAILYGNVNEEKAKEIVENHLKSGKLVQELIVGKPFENI